MPYVRISVLSQSSDGSGAGRGWLGSCSAFNCEGDFPPHSRLQSSESLLPPYASTTVCALRLR